MPRNMSFSLTTEQVRNRTKTVTRRVNWWKNKRGQRIIQQGDIVNACVKCMGLQPGESIERICQIRIRKVTRERLRVLIVNEPYGNAEAIREGFPELGGVGFASMFCEHMGGGLDQTVTRIEFEYVKEA